MPHFRIDDLEGAGEGEAQSICEVLREARGCELELIVGWLDSLEAKIDLELSAMMCGVGEVGP
jgi:hypothetical protein